MSCFTSETWYEETISAEYSYLSNEALSKLYLLVGDDTVGRELEIVPKVIPEWTDADYVDEYIEYLENGEEILMQVPPSHSQISNLWELEDFMKPWNSFTEKSALCSRIDLEKVIVSNRDWKKHIVEVPLLIGGNLYDFVKLRRDEAEAFSAWVKYARQVIGSSQFTNVELIDAIRQGTHEMKARMGLLASKGVIDAIGMTLVSSSFLISQLYEGNKGQLSAYISALAAISMGAKALLEQNKERGLLYSDPRQFLALANLSL